MEPEASSPVPDPAAPAAPTAAERELAVGQIWELEMLISGAVIFALIQLAQGVEEFFGRLAPHLSTGGLAALLILTYYSKAILYALIACFLVNLAARAYWAGLLGLTKVFPGGVRWDRLRYGPLTLRNYRERLPALPAQIARTDRFCSAIFSFTFVIVLMFGFSILLMGFCSLTAVAVDRLFFGGRRFGPVLYCTLGVMFLPLVLGPVLDKLIGKRLDPESRAGRLVRGLVLLNYHGQIAPLYAPVLLTLFSNLRRRFIYPVFYAAFFGCMGMVIADFMVQRGEFDLDAYTYLPAEPGARSVDPRHYANLREPGEREAVPWIQADVVSGPYVKLFIPYVPLRLNEVMAERCPGLRPLQGEGLRKHEEGRPTPAAEEAVLSCLARLYGVKVNGSPVPDLPLRFARDARSGLRGVVAYLPTADLPRGENLLTVEALPRPAGSRRPPRRGEQIPFWR